jgi:hypothetical protein
MINLNWRYRADDKIRTFKKIVLREADISITHNIANLPHNKGLHMNDFKDTVERRNVSLCKRSSKGKFEKELLVLSTKYLN